MSLICGIIEGVYLAGSGTMPLLEELMKPSIPTYTSTIGGVVSFFSVSTSYLQLLFRAMTFDYAFFTNEWVIVRILFMCFSVGIILYLVLSVIRGNS